MIQPSHADILVATVPTYEGQKELRLNIFLPPDGKPPYKTVLYIHGGAFMFGDYTMQQSRSNLWPVIREEFPRRGVAVVCLGYRLATEACFPALVHDIKGGARFIRAHGAKYGLTTERLGVIGESAGGYLTAMLALTAGVPELEGEVGGNLEQSSAVQYAAAIYGIFDALAAYDQFDPLIPANPEALDHTSPQCPEGRLLGLDKVGVSLPQLREILAAGDTAQPHYDKARLAVQANPATHITENAPPMFLGHGDSDSIVPLEQSLDLYGALCRKNVDATLVVGHLQDHGQNFNPRLRQRIVEWITGMANDK